MSALRRQDWDAQVAQLKARIVARRMERIEHAFDQPLSTERVFDVVLEDSEPITSRPANCKTIETRLIDAARELFEGES